MPAAPVMQETPPAAKTTPPKPKPTPVKTEPKPKSSPAVAAPAAPKVSTPAPTNTQNVWVADLV